MVEYLEGKGFGARQLGLLPRRTADELVSKVATPEEPGWRGRVAKAMMTLEGVGSREALVQLYVQQPERVDSLLKKAVELMGARVDGGVTIDTHRVFRMEGRSMTSRAS